MAFKDRIKEARLNKKMTQEQLAQKIGVAKSTVTGYEKGNSEPNMLTVSKMMEALNVDANYLWQDEMAGNFPEKVSYDELTLIEKYRQLDTYGKDTIDYLLSRELDRYNQFKQQQTDQHKAELQAIKEEYESTAMNQPDNIIQFYDEKQNHEQQVELNYRTGGAGAGLGVDADNVDMIQVSYPADRVPAGANHVIPVSGDSMEPTFSDGDVLFFDLGNDCLQIGDIGIFVLNGETLVKELGENELISHNPKYKPIKIHEWDSVRIEGKVLGKM